MMRSMDDRANCLPEGTDLPVYSQAELNQIALGPSMRLRKRH